MGGERLKVGLIGLGAVGRLHLEAYRTANNVTVTAVAEPDQARRAAADGPGVALYADAAEMLARERLDIACVLTPAASHAQLTAMCAAAGVNVLCEKPMAPSLQDATAMIEACRAAQVELAYGASYRFLPAIVRARALIAEGVLGKVVLLREQSIGGAGEGRRPVLPLAHYPQGQPGGGPMGLVDHGIHLIDAFAWLTGAAVTSAFGRGNVSGQAMGVEHLSMTLSNGAFGSLLYDEGTFPTELPGEGLFSWGASWDADGFHPGGAWAGHPGAIHVYGTRGALRIAHYANALFLKTIPQGAATQCYVAANPAAANVTGQYWADSNLKKPRPDAEDAGLATQLWDVSEKIVAGLV